LGRQTKNEADELKQDAAIPDERGVVLVGEMAALGGKQEQTGVEGETVTEMYYRGSSDKDKTSQSQPVENIRSWE